MGGSVLFHLLDRYPNKVVGACFVSSRSRADDLMEKSHRTKTIEKIMKGQRGEVTSLICSQLLSEEAVSKKNELLPALKEWIEATDTRSLISGLQAMRDRKDFTAKTREILHPTLVITGEADRMVPPEHGRGLALSLGAGYELPGAGHMVNLEQPENFNNCLIEFLASIRQCRPKKPSLQKVA
jgi:pimeloyl-ACP methyl ester carboxylesterase